jgi:DNA-binding transcriptional ArsR family regulator
MPRSAIAQDVFVAIADAQRRKIIELLAPRGRTVNEIARGLGMAQPQTSKHLKVLKSAGLVDVQVAGQQRVYTLRGESLGQVQEWTRLVERCWQDRFDQLDELLVELQQEEPKST